MAKSGKKRAREGIEGLEVFAIAGASIAGCVPSYKTGDPRFRRQAFTTHIEETLALYLEYHPHVLSYQRGDALPSNSSVKGRIRAR